MIEIRRALPAEVAALHALIEAAYRGEGAKRGWTHEADLLGGQRTDHDELGAILADDAQAMLVAEESGALVGCVHICRARDELAYLGMLTVDPARQASGLGKRLIDAAETSARQELDARVIEMTVIAARTELIEYYERRGYRLTGERRPFPYGDHTFGLPKTGDLEFVVLEKALA